MFNKDTFRLIRKTSNRFLSLFMILNPCTVNTMFWVQPYSLNPRDNTALSAPPLIIRNIPPFRKPFSVLLPSPKQQPLYFASV